MSSAPDDPYVRLVLELDGGRELRFRDIRKFGKVGIYERDPRTGELLVERGGAGVFAATGPEPLDDAFTLREFRRRLRARRGRLKPLLLDPKAKWDRPALTTFHRNNHAVRTERWRYIRYADGGEELYDHDHDEYEWANLAEDAKYAGVKEELLRLLPTTNKPELPRGKRKGKR